MELLKVNLATAHSDPPKIVLTGQGDMSGNWRTHWYGTKYKLCRKLAYSL